MHSNLITNNEIPTINSREVSQMLEIQHKNLLSKIDLINKDLVAENLATKKYWIEDTFENRVIKDCITPDGKNRPQNRYTDKLRSELINMLK